MPRASKKLDGVEAPNKEYVKTKWVRYELNVEEQGMLKAAIEEDELLLAKALNHFIKMNCKISVEYDYENKCALSRGFPVGERNANAGMAISGRGRYAHTAILEMYWKTKMLHDTWKNGLGSEASGMWDDDIEWA